MNNLTLLGDRVLVQLDAAQDHSVRPSGIVTPFFVSTETDAGRPDVEVSNLKYIAQGTILAISPLAQKRLEETLSVLSVGDKVLLPTQAVTPSYQFFTQRQQRVQAFDGILCLPHSLIEAKIND